MTTLADELDRLDTLKRKAERVGQYKNARDERFKAQQAACLDRMEAERAGSFRSEDTGVLFTRINDRVKGQVEDRRKYIRHQLEQDEAVQEFLGKHANGFDAFEDFLECVLSLEAIKLTEKQDVCNALARAHVDDEQPLPPGLTFRPDPYVQMRRS